MTEIQVCVDCLLLIANGETTESTTVEEHAAKMDALWSDDWHIVLGSDGESNFSWSSCEGCGSKLGGARETAFAVRDKRVSSAEDRMSDVQAARDGYNPAR
jgi:hypothetical protein